MSLTRIQAIDEMMALAKTAWEVTAAQDGARLKWENVGSKSVPPIGQLAWARVVARHTTSGQATLAGTVGERMFNRSGVLTIQVFEPVGNGVPGTVDLAKIMMDCYEGITTTGGVEFRDVRINEIGQDGDFFQTNVIVPFEYVEVK